MQDPLYVGPTRPSTIFSIPFEAWIVVVLLTALVFIGTSSFYSVLIAPVGYGISYLICLRDPRGFELAARWADTKATSISRRHWGAPSRGPMPSRLDQETGGLKGFLSKLVP